MSTTASAPIKTLPDHVRQVLGIDRIKSLAASAGLDPKVVPEKVAEMLPKVVAKLVPEAAKLKLKRDTPKACHRDRTNTRKHECGTFGN
jgi:uncharacterized protein YidB (DUF937 family)